MLFVGGHSSNKTELAHNLLGKTLMYLSVGYCSSLIRDSCKFI